MWSGKWVSFLDTMMQMQILGQPGRSLQLPTRIKSLHVNPVVHRDHVIQIDSERQGERQQPNLTVLYIQRRNPTFSDNCSLLISSRESPD